MTRSGFDAGAPVVIRHQREIACRPERVWDVLTAVDRWSRWNGTIRFALLRGGFRPGASLYWASAGMRVSSVLLEIDPQRIVGWTQRTIGARGYQRWTLEALPSGITRVRLDESWGGVAASILRRTLRQTLELARGRWLEELETECLRSAGRETE